jgi:hypothetical protein
MFSAACLLFAPSVPRLVFWAPLTEGPMAKVSFAVGKVMGDGAMTPQGFQSGGKNGVLFFTDQPQFALGGSFSIQATVKFESLPSNGTSPAGQLVFRGDDRNGLDNYSLNLGNDGYYTFCFNSADGQGFGIRTKATAGKWQTVLGVLDTHAREGRLYVDGFLVAQSAALVLPVIELVKDQNPGLSIGNVQNPLGGVHNQPFKGLIKDVKLWNGAVLPSDPR